ncbi:MAG TPA: ornithine cyclodeaminase family protein [Burkholderiales bacterium]|nr:ornithine cyclodeaminase family protein [Burkholderiales bacterium]
MTVMLGADALEGALSMREAIDLLEEASRHEAAGRTFVSPRLNTSFEGGWMRMMFAADYVAGYAATKAYHLVQGAGVRYLVTLYRLADGEILAIMDGRLITDLRTGAASGVVARRVPVAEPVSIGVIGSGHQARMQLASLASVYRIASVAVFSPTTAHREAFAREMSARLELSVTAVATAQQAVRGKSVAVVATSHRGGDPVLRAAWLEGCRLLCGVGSTRPQSVELDPECFRAARLVVVDSARAAEEAGDLQQAGRLGALASERQATLAQLVAGQARAPREGTVLFKSVGTALQDLALAARLYERLGARPGVPAAPRLASLKEPLSAAGRAGG